MVYYAYILRSKVDGRLYKGHASDLEVRLKEHNSGKTRSTKGYIPWELVYYEEFETKAKAIAREKFFKSGFGREYIKSILDKK
ncbi:GIY-YIG nuclease family protein [Flavobacterium sp.]|jgi:putative endonuclease|uniref:GIY-YIG nuclease family protein n=1 Tax=Flavobacterium sp. TaxID=239 RepID=UPI0022C93DDB|nr:GIY-YIG nuclease family protein [Flavobacterium sp.]MCZ8145708.1 GIY-YIG nuclease family protein [Flavobacterium sp.]MCZ8366092.1 GIY-YIG nuclease family protein [Flavobacterium sp.]